MQKLKLSFHTHTHLPRPHRGTRHHAEPLCQLAVPARGPAHHTRGSRRSGAATERQGALWIVATTPPPPLLLVYIVQIFIIFVKCKYTRIHSVKESMHRIDYRFAYPGGFLLLLHCLFVRFLVIKFSSAS
jgi:hypothetical protein